MKVFEEKHEPKIHELLARSRAICGPKRRETVKERNVSEVPGQNETVIIRVAVRTHADGKDYY